MMVGGGIKIPEIELPFEAQIIIRKCMNRGLILTRKGEVFEMQLGHSYKINDDSEIFSHKFTEDELQSSDVTEATQ